MKQREIRSTRHGGDRPFWYLRRKPDELQAAVDEELRVHLEMRAEELMSKGMSSEAARREARRQFGDFEYTRRYCRNQDERKEAGMRWTLLMDELRGDLRHSVRQVARNPGFTAVAVLTLALGIGANTALFSIFNSLILRPLPVRDPGSLALLSDGSWSYPIWDEIRLREAELFDGTLAWSAQRFDLSAGGQTEPVDGAYVSGGFFDVLGVTAIRGRMLTPADDGGASTSVDRARDGPVAVISDRLWRQRFASAPDIVGRQLTVQRIPFTVVGVMPPGFFGADVGRMTDVMLPFAAEPLIRGKESRLAAKGSWWLQIMARLKPGQTLQQANAALRVIQTQITEGASRQLQPFTLVAASTGNSSLRNRFETPLLAMVVAVGLVLLVACANIASLMLARTLARRREFSVRLALGSSRWRIARLLFIESLIVAVAGAAVGLVFASWSSALLVRQLSTWQSTVSLDLGLDWRVLAFTAALACLSAVIAGVAPVLGLKAVAAGEALKDSGRGIASGGRFSVRGTIVVAQIAVSFALVIAAGLFLRTFASLNRLPLGFVPGPLLVAELNLQAGGGSPEERSARVDRLRDAAAAVAGVRSAAVSSVRLLTGGGTSSGMIAINDGPMSRIRPTLWLNGTTPGWFQTMGIPLRSGRDFETGDRVGGRPVAIVNETFVRRFMAGEQPIGQTVRLGFEPGTRYEIVGVVGDTVYTTPRDGMLATMYVAMAQRKPSEFWPTVLLTASTAGSRAMVERDVAEALRRADPAIGFTFGTFDQLVEATVTQERLIALVSAFFGGLALLLAAVGLYGVVAHAVRARQKEIGLRIALGATPSSILRIVFQSVGLLIAAGLALGLAGSLWAARFLEALLFHLEPRDPATFGGAAAVLVAVAVVAAWVPAYRAARIDPVAALRTE
jgi:putative ABC transport system permease protein